MRTPLRSLRRGTPVATVATVAVPVVLAVLAAGCGGEKPKETAAAKAPRDENTPLAVVDRGLSTPESVLWDKTRRVWYISNVNGSPTAKDDNGYIVRVGPDGEARDSLPFINGADDDITLNAPKGLGLQGDTLWVADIDEVRGFDVTTGTAVATVDLRPLKATFLNDIAVSEQGTLLITDSGIAFGADGSVTHPGLSRVFEIRDRVAKQVLLLPKESAANGIAWWPGRSVWLIVGFNTKDIFQWTPGAKAATVVAQGPGGADGIVVLADGSAVYTSWADSSLTLLAGTLTTTLRRGLPAPADLGYDPLRNVVAVPLFNDNRVEIWPVAASPSANAPLMLRP